MISAIPLRILRLFEFHGHPYTEAGKDLIDKTQQFYLIEERIGAHHVGITLEKLAVTALLRTVGPPHGLYLIAFEGKRELVAVHHHETGKGHCQVIAQPFLAKFRRQDSEIARVNSSSERSARKSPEFSTLKSNLSPSSPYLPMRVERFSMAGVSIC